MSPPLLLKTKKENKKIPVSEYLRGFLVCYRKSGILNDNKAI